MALLLRLILIVLLSQIQPGFSGFAGIFSESKSALEMVISISGQTVSGFAVSKHPIRLPKDPNDRIMEQLDEIRGAIEDVANTLERFESRLDKKIDSMMDTMVNRIVTSFEKSVALRDFQKEIRKVNHLWNTFIDIKRYPKMNNQTVQQFIEITIGLEDHHLSGWLNVISSLINKDSTSIITPTVFDAMLKYHEVYANKICGQGVSPQQEINNFFGIIIMTELRALTMTMYGCLKQAVLTQGSYQEEIYFFGNKTMNRMLSHYYSTKVALNHASKMIRACDPDKFIKEKSYAEMEGAFQSIIVHERDWLVQEQSCKGDCDDLGGKHPYGTITGDACKGLLYNCRGKGDDITFCPADKNSSRRYEWLQEGKISGRACDLGASTAVWWFDFFICEPCICDCAGAPGRTKPRATISLLPAKSHIAKNMVVTGVKIVYKDNVIKLQVREGYLESYGTIAKDNNTSNKNWVPTRQLKLLPHAEKPTKKKRKQLLEDKDYVFMSRSWQTISLSDISVPKGYVVAGVKFSPRIDNTSFRYIDLRVLGVQFNYSTGAVNVEKRKWFSSNISKIPIKFENPDIPFKYKFNIPRLEPNLRVDFQASGDIDSGQTTIPFWDIQKVVTTPPTPLQGVGLLHKGHEYGKYGGYIALRLSTFDYSLYFG